MIGSFDCSYGRDPVREINITGVFIPTFIKISLGLKPRPLGRLSRFLFWVLTYPIFELSYLHEVDRPA